MAPGCPTCSNALLQSHLPVSIGQHPPGHYKGINCVQREDTVTACPQLDNPSTQARLTRKASWFLPRLSDHSEPHFPGNWSKARSSCGHVKNNTHPGHSYPQLQSPSALSLGCRTRPGPWYFIRHRGSPVRMWGNTPAFPCLYLLAACRKKAGFWLLAEGLAYA